MQSAYRNLTRPRAMAFVLVVAALVTIAAHAAVKTLTIEPPTTRVDGSPLPADEIARHQVGCRVNGGEWRIERELEMPIVSEDYDFQPHGSWECRGYAVDTHGQISDPGDAFPFVVTPARPSPPAIVIR